MIFDILKSGRILKPPAFVLVARLCFRKQLVSYLKKIQIFHLNTQALYNYTNFYTNLYRTVIKRASIDCY
jgi:hypothetical protein